MEESVFREKSLAQISSPEQLNDYIKVSGPSVWVVLAAVLLLLFALFFWAITGSIPLTLNVSGMAENGEVTCYVSAEDAAKLTPGMPVQVDGAAGSVLAIGEVPLSYAEAAARYANDYTSYALGLGEWNVPVTVKADVSAGVHALTFVTDAVQPIRFLFN